MNKIAIYLVILAVSILAIDTSLRFNDLQRTRIARGELQYLQGTLEAYKITNPADRSNEGLVMYMQIIELQRGLK